MDQKDYEGANKLGDVKWSIIHDNEGSQLEPYTFVNVNGGTGAGHSGVTIGTGVDLGSVKIDPSTFQNLFKPYAANSSSDPNLNLLYRAVNQAVPLTLDAAAAFLGDPNGKIVKSTVKPLSTVQLVQSISSSITPSQENVLTNYAEQAIFDPTDKNWQNNSHSNIPFDAPLGQLQLPGQIQTVMVDETYNTGSVIGTVFSSIVAAAKTIDAKHPLGLASAWGSVSILN